jgi:peptidoglycan hydrolase-like protein with peptidoglycan-binding domain
VRDGGATATATRPNEAASKPDQAGPTGAAWLDDALKSAFGPGVNQIAVEHGADAENAAIGALAHTEGRTVRLSSSVKPDDAQGLEIIGEEVAHAMAGGGSGETSLDLPGDPGESAAKQTGKRFADQAQGRAPASALAPATGGRARLHRRSTAATTWNGTPMLSIGSKGSYVNQLQTLLNANGARISVDGDFGPQTDGAVRAFQRAKRLGVDGIAGPSTAAALRGAGPAKPATPAGPAAGAGAGATAGTGGGPLTGEPPLSQGAKGDQVKTLQTKLNGFKANLGVDGEFGGRTAAAVRGFQKANGLPETGVVNVATVTALNNPQSKPIAVAAADPKVRTNGDPGGRLSSSKMNPDVRRMANQVIADLQAKGLKPYVVDGWRSFEDQNKAFERGNSKVKAGGSWHNYGLAVDFAWWDDAGKAPTWSPSDPKVWNSLGEAGKRIGFTAWGGDWGWDKPHLEYHPKWSKSSAYGVKPTFDKSGLQGVWDLVT